MRLKTLNEKTLLVFLYLIILAPLGYYCAKARYDTLLAYLPFHTGSFREFLNLSATSFANSAGLLDMASYIKAAQYFLVNGSIPLSTLQLWPVGQPLLLASIFEVFGENHYPLTMLFYTVLIWSITLVFVYDSLSDIKNRIVRFFFSLAPFYFVTIRIYLFGSEMFMTEATTVPLMIIAICYFLKWLKYNQTRHLVSMSLLLALAAYFRGYFELFGNFLIIVILSAMLIRIFYDYIISRIKFANLTCFTTAKTVIRQNVINNRSKAILISLLIFFISLMPGRIYNYIYLHSFAWLQYTNSIWLDFWQPDNILKIPRNQTYNIACHIYPQICATLSASNIIQNRFEAEFFRDSTIMTFLQHPLIWYGDKIRYFNVFWFGDFTESISWHDLIHYHKWMLCEGVFVFLLGICSFLWMLWQVITSRTTQMKGLLIFSGLFMLFNIILFTFFHYEGRYSLYLRIFFIYLPIWGCCYRKVNVVVKKIDFDIPQIPLAPKL